MARTTDSNTDAMMPHLLGIFTSFIGPLVLYISNKDVKDKVILHNSVNALNFHLSLVFYTFLCFFAIIISVVGFAFSELFLIPLILFYLVIILLGILALITGIIGSIRGYNGEIYKYPLTIRFVKR
jgi:uncharacterized protein